jgi:hypothetical protein
VTNWNHMVPGMQQSSAEFYSAIDHHLKKQGLEDTKTERVNIAEGGILSAKREYFQVRPCFHRGHSRARAS